MLTKKSILLIDRFTHAFHLFCLTNARFAAVIHDVKWFEPTFAGLALSRAFVAQPIARFGRCQIDTRLTPNGITNNTRQFVVASVTRVDAATFLFSQQRRTVVAVAEVANLAHFFVIARVAVACTAAFVFVKR